MYSFYLPAFRKEHYLVLTSFKVMYSFLKCQNSLERVLWGKHTLSVALSNRLFGSPEGIVLFREPENRFLSYFNDKFRKTPRKMLAEQRLHPTNLQHCQRLWLEHIGMNTDDVVSCCQALLETPLESVVDWLPTSYHKDPHTLSQLECLYFQRPRVKLRLAISKVFLMDNPGELQAFGQLLELDTSCKVHHTQDIQEKTTLTESARETLRRIYKADSDLYQQICQTPLNERSAVLHSVLAAH